MQPPAFLFPPHHTPKNDKPEVGIELKVAEHIKNVLRDHVAFTAATRSEIRQARREIKELTMKVSELATKLDTLISLATDLKANPPVPPDDPEIETMAGRVDTAITMLQNNHATPTNPPLHTPLDPNAPV